MPIYEYLCGACGTRQSVFFRSIPEAPDPPCRRCGAAGMRRLVSRFSSPRSEEDRIEAMSDPATFGDFDEDDPGSVARWARRMAAETGDELGDDFDQMVEELEAGVASDQSAEPGLPESSSGDLE